MARSKRAGRRSASSDRRRTQTPSQRASCDDQVAPALESPRSVMRWIVLGFCILLICGLLVTYVQWSGPTRRTGDSMQPAASASLPKSEIRLEFERVAEILFTTPGTEMHRTWSTALRSKLADEGLDWPDEVRTRVALIHALLQDGDTDDAVKEVGTLFSLLSQRPEVIDNSPGFHRVRALAYLRLAEQENCVKLHNRDCCIFPLKGGGVHTKVSPARNAAESYLAYLGARPDDLSARWLLNITHMAMGTYPDSVPPEFLVPAKGPGSSDDFPRFHDVALATGITRLNRAGGSVVDDMDGDGLLDIVLSSCAPDVSLVYYHNQGNGMFEDRTPGSGLDDQLGGLNLISTDYDNDGDIDLFVLRGAWCHELGRIRNSLLRNNSDGTFTDVTRVAGLAEPMCPTQAAVWFDYDHDGDLDVFVGNESLAEVPAPAAERPRREDYPCNLFRNNGDGTFTDVARQAGVTNDRYTKSVAAGDFDNDGWVDLYISNIGVNRLYRNNGDGTFIDLAERLNLTEPARRSFVAWFFDFDNDGYLDIFVGAYDEHLGDQAAWYLRLPFQSAPPRLYRNNQDGTFTDLTQAAGLWRPLQPMGANFGDLDNDAWLDVYLATGNPDYEALVPNVMFRNVGGRRFEDVTVAGGFGNLQKGHGVAFADLDNDGDQDVFNELGGFYQGDAFYNTLYENPGNANGFLTLKLVGRQSNRLAYGARIKVVVTTPAGRREIHRAVGSVSSFGGSPSRQEIGLGDATEIQSVEIRWPASGTVQVLTNLEMNSFYEVTEGAVEPRKLFPPTFKFGHP